MGRNRTPTAILDAKGAFIANPQREREGEPEGKNPLGSPPAYLKLTPEEKKVWRILAKKLLHGVAFEADEAMFADLVRLTTKWINNEPMMAADHSRRLSLASRFAMTPADRSKVSVEKPKESKMTEFLNRRRAAQEAEVQVH